MRNLALAALLMGAAAGCGRADAATKRAPDPIEDGLVAVRLAEVLHGPVSRPIRGTGLLRRKSEVDLSFKVGGVIASVFVEEGARVRRGQVLARLDPTEVEAALRQSKEATAKAERDLERTKKLHATGAVAPIELQNAETALALAEAGKDAAAFNASRSTIVAPDDGRIDKRFVEAGEVIAPGRPVFHLSGQAKGAVVRIGVSDRDVLRVRDGDVARVVLDARPELPIDGRVSQVATVATPGAGTFEVEVKLQSAEALPSGLTAKVEIAHAEEVGAVVPAGAVVFGARDSASVFVVPDGAPARRIPVKVAFVDGDRIALATSLDGKVVDSGASRLEDGTRVRVVP